MESIFQKMNFLEIEKILTSNRYKDNNNVWKSLFYLNGKLLSRDNFFKDR